MDFSILIIEDDPDIQTMIAEALDDPGYEIHKASDGKEALEQFRNIPQIDLILLDLMLPKIDGLTVLKRIRQKSTVPILILSAKNSESEKVLGLEYGADDYITKPFSIMELQARVKAFLRRAREYQPTETAKKITIGSLVIDLENLTVKKADIEINLTAKEYSLLALFAAHPEKIYTKVQLYKEIWDDQYLKDENVINVTIRRLREKIEDNPSAPEYIKTVWGIGYKLGEVGK